MCTPLVIAGLALTAGSMVANSVAAGQVEGARNDVLLAEHLRQQGFDRKAETLNATSQGRFIGFEPQREVRAADLGDYLGTRVTPDANTAAASIMPSSSSDIVNQETAKQRDEAQEFVDQQTGALADLRAFGDLLGEKSRLQARDAGKIAQIGGFKVGSQGIVPYELDHAASAGDGMKLFGDLLRLGGTVATGAGLGKGKPTPFPMPRPKWLDYRPTEPTHFLE
jgi:hypothetical protein